VIVDGLDGATSLFSGCEGREDMLGGSHVSCEADDVRVLALCGDIYGIQVLQKRGKR
jgi:hypothetical protein